MKSGSSTQSSREADILFIMAEGLEATGLLPVSPAGRLTSTWGQMKGERTARGE
jgi:hypothetical protein